MSRDVIFICIMVSMNTIGSAQSLPKEFMLPASFHKTKSWLAADNVRKGMLMNGQTIFSGYEGKAPDTMKIADCLRVIRSEKKFGAFLNAKSWAIKNYTVAFPYLVEMITDTTLVGLTNTADLIIPGRDLPFYGHGGVIRYDLFAVACRVSYILNEMTGENFAVVQPGNKIADLLEFQVLWAKWIKSLKK